MLVGGKWNEPWLTYVSFLPYLAPSKFRRRSCEALAPQETDLKNFCVRLPHIFCGHQLLFQNIHGVLLFLQTHVFGMMLPILTRFPNPLGAVVSFLCRIWNQGYLSQWVIIIQTKDVFKKFRPSLHVKLTERNIFSTVPAGWESN